MNTLIALLPDWLKTHQPHLQAIASIITILGVPVGIAVYIYEKSRERHDREYGTYITLTDKYIDFLKICFDHPELDIYETSVGDRAEMPQSVSKDPLVLKKEWAMYIIFITMCERAFLVYRRHSKRSQKRQWKGWEEYIREYCRHKGFRAAWPTLGRQFDNEFLKYVNTVISEIDLEALERVDSKGDWRV